MSTDYFVLTKPTVDAVVETQHQYSVCFDNKLAYILPKNNLAYYKEHGLFESSLIEWCKEFCDPGKTFLDIGAHSGTYTVSLARHCKEVYSFEPQKMTYYTLCGSVALSNLPNVTCLPIGLGSEGQRGKCVLNIISDDGGGSSIHARSNPVLRQEEIEIKTLDEVWSNFSLPPSPISFIKMDVEDNEYDVLLGASETIRKNGYPKILFEMNDPNSGEKTVDLLKDFGYAIHPIRGYGNMFLASV
jgi:FkbM family methyltransferase